MLALLEVTSDEDPVEASDMEDPEDENKGKDLSDGDGDGGFRLNPPVAVPLLLLGDSCLFGLNADEYGLFEGDGVTEDTPAVVVELLEEDAGEDIIELTLLADRSTVEIRLLGLYFGASLKGTKERNTDK